MGQLYSTLEHLPGVGDDGAIQAPDAGSRWRRRLMKSGCNHVCNHAIMYAIGRRRQRVKVGDQFTNTNSTVNEMTTQLIQPLLLVRAGREAMRGTHGHGDRSAQ